ncbi:MAG TPA: P-loop NTPase [bacterium]|nr:P-loop NTPase [bacterium]
MLTKEKILEVLKGIRDPEIGENIVDLNMVRGINVGVGGVVDLEIALTVPECPLTATIRRDVNTALTGLGASSVNIKFTSMSESERGALIQRVQEIRRTRMQSQAGSQPQGVMGVGPISRLSKGLIHNIVAVGSGKGGVGKSTVTAILAVELARRGFRVGILDADVTGPSIPRLFGLKAKLETDGKKIFPATTAGGIRVVSVNLILPSESDATIWRGPIINGVIRQLYTDVDWGELDYMLVDLPPGTSDAPLTVFQSLPLDGFIVVTSPQELAQVIVGKAVNMAKKMNVPVFGLVENMVYMVCPHCGERVYIYGEGRNQLAERFGLKVLGSLPIDPELPKICDEGRIEEYVSGEAASIINRMGEVRVNLLNLKAAAPSNQ